jgi:predicted transcriptional regulator
MEIKLETLANGFVLNVVTRQGHTRVFYSYDDYEKVQKEMSEVVSEYVAQVREFISQQKDQSEK